MKFFAKRFCSLASVCVAMLVAASFVWVMCVPVHAEEDDEVHKSYVFMTVDGVTQWYEEAAPFSGPYTPVSSEEIVKNRHTLYSVNTDPANVLVKQVLESAAEIGSVFFQCPSGMGDIVLGSANHPITIQSNLNVNVAPGTKITVYGSVSNLFVQSGSVEINGDVLAELRIEVGTPKDIAINGNVHSVVWQKISGASTDTNLTVSGTVAKGYLQEKKDGAESFITKSWFEEATGAILENGVLNAGIPLKDVSELGWTKEYQCYCMPNGTANDWELMITGDGVYESETLVNFDPADIPAGSQVSVYSAHDPVVISVPLETLHVASGTVTVNGNVDRVTIQWTHEDKSWYSTHIDVTVNGNVNQMDVVGTCRKAKATVTGTIGSGIRQNNNYEVQGYFKKNAADQSLIIDQGKLYPVLYSDRAFSGAGIQMPSAAEMEDILGINKETDVKKNAAGEVTAFKTAELENKNGTADGSIQESLKEKDMEAVAWLDMSVYSYYENLSNGSVEGERTRETELANPLTITLTIPKDKQDAEGKFQILRNHNGQVDVLEDLDSDPNTVTFKTDKFSAYAIAVNKAGQEEPEAPEPEEPEAPEPEEPEAPEPEEPEAPEPKEPEAPEPEEPEAPIPENPPVNPAPSSGNTSEVVTSAGQEVIVTADSNAMKQVITKDTLVYFASDLSVENIADATVSEASVEDTKKLVEKARSIAGENAFIAGVVDLHYAKAGVITMHCSNVWKGQDVTVLHIKSDGTIEVIKPDQVEDNKITFTLTSNSPIAIMINTANTQSPKTGDTSVIFLWMALLALAGAGLAFRKAFARAQ